MAHPTNMIRPSLLLLLVATANGYVTNPPHQPFFDANGIFRQQTSGRQTKSIDWPSATAPVPIEKEIALLRSGALLRRGEFGPLRGSRELELELECAELGLTFNQGVSIRKQLMMQKMLTSSWKLKDDSIISSIQTKFEKQRTPLLDISEEYNLSPISIFRRAILQRRVLGAYPQFTCANTKRPAGRIVQSIISESTHDGHDHVTEFLSTWELEQLQIAKEHDLVGYRDNSTDAAKWEEAIYNYLDSHNIRYITEDTLKEAGHESKGTPDCLLLDDLYINGRKVAWIEFKSFYASGLRENSYFARKALSKQIRRYEGTYGKNGAVIMKNGYSEEIARRYKTLFLDGGPLHPVNDLRP